VPLTTCTRELIYVPLSPDSNSTMRTHTNVYSDTSDKLAIGWGSPQKFQFTRDPSGQHQNGSPFPEASHPPESWSKATSAYIVRRDGMTHVRKPCTITRLLHFIGRCRGQHIPSTPPRRGSVTTKLSRSRQRHHGKVSRALATERPGYIDDRPPADLEDDILA
jgi:hypothetical protein